MCNQRSGPAGDKNLASLSPEVEFSDSNNAWYSARLLLRGNTLIVSYLDFPDSEDEHFSPDNFSTADEITAFRRRFRSLSTQLQDSQCPQVRSGTPVCASCFDRDKDSVLFYDAVVDSVKRDQHIPGAEGEECLCTFILSWTKGPKVGTLSLSKIEGICLIQPSAVVDPRLDSFIRMCEVKLQLSPLSLTTVLQNSACKIDYESHEEDYDMGGGHALTGSISRVHADQSSDCYFILIDNMEKDLLPSTVVSFIHKHISIYVKAYIFLSIPSELYARGAIVVDCAEKFQKLYDFVINKPDQIIISSKGRPWIVAGESRCRSSSVWLMGSDIEITDGNPGSTLKIIRPGCEEYDTAFRRQGLMLEFKKHMWGLRGRLFAEDTSLRFGLAPDTGDFLTHLQ